jgi:hypothetical protein
MMKALIWGKPGLEEQAEVVYDAAGPQPSRTLEKGSTICPSTWVQGQP